MQNILASKTLIWFLVIRKRITFYQSVKNDENTSNKSKVFSSSKNKIYVMGETWDPAMSKTLSM